MTTVQRWTGAETKALREALRLSVRDFAAYLDVDRRTVNKWEARGAGITLLPKSQELLDTALGRASEEVRERFVATLQQQTHAAASPGPDTLGDAMTGEPPMILRQVESVRRAVHDALSERAMTNASLDDWEQTARRHGAATKHRSADLLLGDLTADFVELKRALTGCRSASALRRLTRTAAHMSGLMCLTLIKLDERAAFRGWARTARIAASEAGDPVTHSWVLAQEAYGHYYSNHLTDAVDVARQAQVVVGARPCVGSVLAAALEARAHAALGRAVDTYAALHQAEAILSGLDSDDMTASAFGYSEAQLRFHESNALTHLGDTRSAWKAQDQALRLVAPGDFMDEAFTQLDRAMCLAKGGDTASAVAHTSDTLLNLTQSQRHGIIGLRVRQIVAALPVQAHTQPAVLVLDDLLNATAADPKE